MGKVPCEECHGDRYLRNERFDTTETCWRCHGEGTNSCRHDNVHNFYRGIHMYVSCATCGDVWEVVN